MKTLKYDFIRDLDENTKKFIRCGYKAPRLPLNRLPISTSNLSATKQDWLKVIEVSRDKVADFWGEKHYVVRVRVLADVEGFERGINVVVPCDTDLQYKKYLDLRDLVRNCESVRVKFLNLAVSPSRFNHRALYLTADDYKQFDIHRYQDELLNLI